MSFLAKTATFHLQIRMWDSLHLTCLGMGGIETFGNITTRTAKV